MCKISAREKCFWWKIGRLLFIINKWANCISLNNSNKYQKLNLQMNSKTACRGFKSFCPCQKNSYRQVAVFFFYYEKDLKDEQYRATVLRTVVTARDQAPAGARVKSYCPCHSSSETVDIQGFRDFSFQKIIFPNTFDPFF